jgi:hypothetical protein
VVRAVAAARHIGNRNERPKGGIIEGVRSEEILVLVVASRSPEVADLLGTDLRIDSMRWAGQWGSGKLEDGKGWCILREWLRNTCDIVSIVWDERLRDGCLPGMRGIRGGRERALAVLASNAARSVLESMVGRVLDTN